jgi:hypothetical protein
LETNEDIYQKLHIPVLHVIHTAVCYAKDISQLHMKMCVHLYEEKEKHPSWDRIQQNYTIPLGIPIISQKFPKKRNDIEKCRISIVGRISPEKIPLSFLHKLCACKTSHSITIYGEKHDEYNASYIQEFDACIANSRIHYKGFQSMDVILAQTDVLVIPSLYETGSYTCIEALQYHIPVIARSGFGGIPSLITSQENGYLCASDEEILDCIRHAHQLRGNTIPFDTEKYNILNVMKQYETILEKNIQPHQTLFMITSVIHPSNEPLSYYPIRSVFNVEERWKQTMDTISSIRKQYPEAMIVLCEGSIYDDENEKIIQQEVDLYIQVNQTEISKHPYKGMGVHGNEDIYFCNKMRELGYKLPDKETCNKFSVETEFELGSVGYHAIDKYHNNYKEIIKQYDK